MKIYSYADGEIDDSLASVFYEELRQQNLLKKVFYDGCVQSLEDFYKFLTRMKNVFFVIEENKLVGFFYLVDEGGKTASIHFCIFKKFWGSKGMKIGADVIRWIFAKKMEDGSRRIEILEGLTPVTLKNALVYLEKIGFRKVGIKEKASYISRLNEHVDAVKSVCYADEILRRK